MASRLFSYRRYWSYYYCWVYKHSPAPLRCHKSQHSSAESQYSSSFLQPLRSQCFSGRPVPQQLDNLQRWKQVEAETSSLDPVHIICFEEHLELNISPPYRTTIFLNPWPRVLRIFSLTMLIRLPQVQQILVTMTSYSTMSTQETSFQSSSLYQCYFSYDSLVIVIVIVTHFLSFYL